MTGFFKTPFWRRLYVAPGAAAQTLTATGIPTIVRFGLHSTSFSAPAVVVQNQPLMRCEISLSDPTAAPVWTDVSDYLKYFRINRGRTFELDRVQASTATVVLNNSDGRFNPYNPSGAYAPNLRRHRRVRLKALWANGTYYLFSGYVEQWPQNILAVNDVESAIPLVDGIGVLSFNPITNTYPQELSHLRIQRVLSDAQWTTGQAWVLADPTLGVLGTTTRLAPVGDQQLAVGTRAVQASVLDDADALGHIQRVQDTENGWTFIAADGTFTFYNRSRRYGQAGKSTLATFGDRPTAGVGEMMYVNAMVSDDQPIYNVASVTREGDNVVPQVRSDTTSRARYFPRRIQMSTLDVDDNFAGVNAAYIVARYKEPAARVTSLELDPAGRPSELWPQVLSRELADPITVIVRPPGSDAFTQPSWIEGIEHEWSATGGDWRTVWHLSPIDQTEYWQLAVHALGVSTTLGY